MLIHKFFKTTTRILPDIFMIYLLLLFYLSDFIVIHYYNPVHFTALFQFVSANLFIAFL